jgi:hypothetical protein
MYDFQLVMIEKNRFNSVCSEHCNKLELLSGAESADSDGSYLLMELRVPTSVKTFFVQIGFLTYKLFPSISMNRAIEFYSTICAIPKLHNYSQISGSGPTPFRHKE